MTSPLPPALRFKIVRLLLLHCHFDTVYRIQKNLFMFHSSLRSQFRSKDAPRKVFEMLITYLK
jgi:hypothetical protein